jgi:hypothetical protein
LTGWRNLSESPNGRQYSGFESLADSDIFCIFSIPKINESEENKFFDRGRGI